MSRLYRFSVVARPEADAAGSRHVAAGIGDTETGELMSEVVAGTGIVVEIVDSGGGDLKLVISSDGTTGPVTSVNGETGAVDLDAPDIDYDNVASGLVATDVQAAIDELDGSIDSLQAAVTGLQSASDNASLWLSWEEDSSGPTLDVITGEIRGWVLPNTTTTGISTQVVTPKAMDTATDPILQIPLWVHMTGAASANVRLRLEARYIANGEQVDKTVDETILQTFPVTNTGDELHLTSFTLTGSLIALSDTINLHLERLGSDAADTFTGQIAIVKSARFDYSEAV